MTTTTLIPTHQLQPGDVIVNRVTMTDGGTLDHARSGRSYVETHRYTVTQLTPVSSRKDRRGFHVKWSSARPAPAFHIITETESKQRHAFGIGVARDEMIEVER